MNEVTKPRMLTLFRSFSALSRAATSGIFPGSSLILSKRT
ncbi:hypothetical protein HMPREF9006_1687 [Actinomyces sp. oral taxon 180 str. F0310]|nr:hypothetical protein HMPREF9006_1687 [Actinomyces sp. oral taxon 180 str. F0310]